MMYHSGMNGHSTMIRGGTVVTPSGVYQLDVVIAGGLIAELRTPARASRPAR